MMSNLRSFLVAGPVPGQARASSRCGTFAQSPAVGGWVSGDTDVLDGSDLGGWPMEPHMTDGPRACMVVTSSASAVCSRAPSSLARAFPNAFYWYIAMVGVYADGETDFARPMIAMAAPAPLIRTPTRMNPSAIDMLFSWYLGGGIHHNATSLLKLQ